MAVAFISMGTDFPDMLQDLFRICIEEAFPIQYPNRQIIKVEHQTAVLPTGRIILSLLIEYEAQQC